MIQKKKKGRKIISFLLTLAMLVGLMPGMGMTAQAKELEGYINVIYDLQEGDIIGSSVQGIYMSDVTITFKAGGYYCHDSESVGGTDVSTSEWDYDSSGKRFTDSEHEYEWYYPYCNGHQVEAWRVVSVSTENNTLTLTGYEEVQNDNPFTQAVIYRHYNTNGNLLENGSLASGAGIMVESDTVKWTDGKTYVVSGDVTIDKRVKVTGTVNLILLDGSKLTVNKGISVNGSEYFDTGETLNIYAGSTSDTISGTGELVADVRESGSLEYAGIGGDDHTTGGYLNIHGGVIKAYGNVCGAGIGGGNNYSHKKITIYGGTITAIGGDNEYYGSAGIGGGFDASGGELYIYGGNVTATGTVLSAGIGGGGSSGDGGSGGNVYIYGGNVVATGGNGRADGIGGASGYGGGDQDGAPGNLTLGCVKLETSTDNVNWTETTDTGNRTQYMKITPVPHDWTEHPAVAATCTTAGNSAYYSCNRCGKYFSDAEGLNEIAENSWVIPATGHNLSYSADNNTITATCSNSGCELDEGISLSAPEELIFDGSSKKAHISTGYDTTVFPYVSDITYTKDNVALTGAPVDVGTYVASVNVGASELNCKTASVTYTIKPATMTVDASDVNVVYDGNPHGISVNVSKPENGSTVIFGREEGTYDQSESPTITYVSDSPFTVYYKVTADNYEDYTGSAYVTITNASQTAPDAPTMDSATATSITLTNVTGCEYSKDGSTWQTSNIFTGLIPDTTYTFYQRKAAVTNYNASLASPGAEFSTSAHVHSFSYTADGDTITATCNDHDGCPLADSDYKATLTISANGGTYDGTTSYGATITDENNIKGDAKVQYQKKNGATYETATETAPTDAGTYKASITLGTGNNSATASVEYTIAKKPVTVSGITASDKTYDGNTTATLVTTAVVFEGKLDSDTLTISATGTFDNANVGDNKTVTITNLTLDGTSKDNYVLAATGQQTGTNAKITAKEVGLTWTDTELTYNGQEQIPTATATGLVSGDVGKVNVTVTGGQTNAQTEAYTATASGLTGDKADNYKLPDETTTSFTISPKSITGAVVTLNSTQLTYNGSEQSVSVTAVSLDDVTLNAADYTVSGNTGTNKSDYTVTVTGKGNYKDAATADWKIVAKAMTVTAEPVSKTYDGNEYGITVNVTDPSSGTTVMYGTEAGTYNLDASPKFKDAGTHTVYYKVSGNNDYSDYEGSATVTILKKAVTANVSAEDKPYDGKTDATVSASVKVEDLISGDSIDIAGIKGNFVDANVGAGKKVTVDSSAKSISGSGSDNYEVTIPTETTASISKSEPKVTAPAPKTLNYTGSAQELVTAGSTTDGEMRYAVTSENTAPKDTDYTISIPTVTDAGTYYIWYKVVGDENHFDSDPKCIVVTIEKPVYSNYEGDGGKWTKGSTDGLKFTFKRSAEDVTTIEHFAGILVDGKEVAESNYDAVSGSVVITLKAPYLETLSAGEHILTAKFNDGDSADAGFTIIEVPAADDNNDSKAGDDSKSGGTADSNESKKTDVKNHKTGDGVPIGLIMIIGLASLVGAVWSLVFKKNLKPTKK